MDVGVIGLGGMGAAMARNLLRAGHRVRVWNRSPAPVEALVALGAVAASPKEAFAGEAVITMLADDAVLRRVVLDDGLLDSAPEGLLHIGMATISVALAKELVARHAEKGLGYISAPVFGRTDAAEAGKLSVVAAGEPGLIDRAAPLFEAIAQKTWRVGDDAHRANVVKLCGNYLIAASIQTIGEAMALGEGHGVERTAVLDVLTGTLFGGVVHKNYGAAIAAQKYEPAAFKLTLGAKDVRLALEAAEAAHVPMPVAGILRDGFLDAIAHGDAGLDWTALAKVSFRRAGLE